MIDRTLVTYTFLSYLNDKGLKQLDLYIPLVCKCLEVRNVSTINRSDVEQWFKEDYGIANMNKGVYDSILKRMTRQYIKWNGHEYEVVHEKVKEFAEKYTDDENPDIFRKIVIAVRDYAKTKYNTDCETSDIETGLLVFFHSHDGDMLFKETQLLKTLEKQKEGKTNNTKIKYIISHFIIDSQQNDLTSFNLIKRISKGHALASIVTMKDVDSYIGKMKGVIVALDAPILFNLMGLNEDSNKELIEELLTILRKQEVKFIIFQEHHEEVLSTLASTIHRLYTKSYSNRDSSRLLKYALRKRMTSQQLNIILQQLPQILSKWNITIEPAPATTDNYGEIDLKLLETLMINRYTDGKPDELEESKRKIIETDVDVVSYIFRLRGKNVATNLKSCIAILLTNNTALAYASRNHKVSNIPHIIPVCLTDVFLSTILWLNYPQSQTGMDINEKVLISECYKNISLSDDLLKRFFLDVEELNKKSALSEEVLLDANTSDHVIALLEDKTFNDPTLYSDQTAAEILEEIENARLAETKALQTRINKVNVNAEKRSLSIARILYWVFFSLLVVLFLFLHFIDYTKWYGRSIVYNIISIIPAVWGLLCYGGIIPSKLNVILWLKRCVYKLLYKDLDERGKSNHT